jgi:glutamate-1-semialdehyde aminotransferase
MIARGRLQVLMGREEHNFVATHPRSAALYERAQKSLLGGVPMNWMKKWAGKFPVFVAEAETIARQAARGITLMLPTEDAAYVGEELARRFGLPYWQFTLTATDANRFAIRIARETTGRPKILVYNYCYHGTVDETYISLGADGGTGPRRGNIGPPVNPSVTTRVVEFNDLGALERELAHGDVACILAEPVLTNVGIVHPEPGYWEKAAALARTFGTLLIIDETHTICTGAGGYTRAHGLHPDIFVIGKPIASGVPAATYGCTAEVAGQISKRIQLEDCDTGGIGGTLAGNALSLAAIRATLEQVLTPAAFAKMIPLAERFADGVLQAIEAAKLPWHVSRLGCRAEYLFLPHAPRNGGEAAAAMDFELERFMHLYALNRGILLTPFHNMALMSPATSEADIDRHTRVFTGAVTELTQ